MDFHLIQSKDAAYICQPGVLILLNLFGQLFDFKSEGVSLMPLCFVVGIISVIQEDGGPDCVEHWLSDET